MLDELFFSKDHKSLRRGRRGAKRTPVRRRVEFRSVDEPNTICRGVVADISRGGMRILTRSWLPTGSRIEFDVKKDSEGLGTSLIKGMAEVIRSEKSFATIYSLGVKFMETEAIAQTEQRRTTIRPRTPARAPASRRGSRMHTVDITLSERGR